MMKMILRITCLLFLGRKCMTMLSLLLFTSASVQASDALSVFGLAKDRWYVQDVVEDKDVDRPRWNYAIYLDLGYTLNFNQPGNGLWRSKTTTFKVNNPEVNMAMGYIKKNAIPHSRWGMEFGLQAGVDTKKLVPETPPDFNEPISNADFLRHIYRANGTYLFPVGKGLEVTAGLINSYIGYESYFAIQNPNYTRGYLLDFVPYFLFGAKGTYPLSNTLDLSLFVLSGWNYLAHPSSAPSYGLQTVWQLTPNITFTQNL